MKVIRHEERMWEVDFQFPLYTYDEDGEKVMEWRKFTEDEVMIITNNWWTGELSFVSLKKRRGTIEEKFLEQLTSKEVWDEAREMLLESTSEFLLK